MTLPLWLWMLVSAVGGVSLGYLAALGLKAAARRLRR